MGDALAAVNYARGQQRHSRPKPAPPPTPQRGDSIPSGSTRLPLAQRVGVTAA